MNETKISSLILKSGQKLISILIPKIVDLIAVKSKIDTKLIIKVISMDKESAKQGGIDEILKQAGKIGVCIPAVPLQAIVDVRNSMMDSLNAASTSVDTLSKTLNPLKTTSDGVTKTIDVTNVAISVAKIAVALIPTPPPPIPSPASAALLQVGTVEKLVETLKFNLNGIINQINSTQGAIDSVNPIFTKITNLFKVIDKYLLGCNVNTANLTPLNPSLQALDNIQKQQVVDAQKPTSTSFSPITYKGFILDIVTVPFSPTVNRVRAVAKNPQDIIMLQTPLSFTTTPQVLISEIKLIIDSNPNLKAE
jgi:prefoldin subunit 5